MSKLLDRDSMARRYHRLCEIRDKAYQEAEEMEQKLTDTNFKIGEYQKKADALSQAIEGIWDEHAKEYGGWISLKSEIADIARFLRKIPSRKEN